MIRFQGLWRSIDPRRRRRATIVAALISTGLIAVLLSLTSFGALQEALMRMRPGWLLLAFATMVATYATIALRLMMVLRLRGRAALYNTTDVTVVHATLLVMLPARLGDVCYPLLLRRSLGLELTPAVVNLLALRVYDFTVAGVLLLAALIGVGIEGENGTLVAWGTLSALAVVAAGVLAAYAITRAAAGRGPEAGGSGLVARVTRILADANAAIHVFGAREHGVLAVSTVMRWLLSAALVYALFQAVVMDIGLAGALFVAMGLNLAVALPLQTIGGFGLVEGAMAFLLGMLGVPVAEAVTAAVAVRIAWLLLLAVCTLLQPVCGARHAEPPAMLPSLRG